VPELKFEQLVSIGDAVSRPVGQEAPDQIRALEIMSRYQMGHHSDAGVTRTVTMSDVQIVRARDARTADL